MGGKLASEEVKSSWEGEDLSFTYLKKISSPHAGEKVLVFGLHCEGCSTAE